MQALVVGMPMPGDSIAALEAIDGKSFIAEHLERAQPRCSSADQAVFPSPHAASIERFEPRERELIDYACRRHCLRQGTA